MQKQFCKEILKKISHKYNLEETHYSNKNSEEEVCTENIWREIIARKSQQRNPRRKSQNSNSCPTKFWRETSSNKYLKRKFFTKKFLKRNHCQKICDKAWKEESPRKKSKHFWQNLFDNFSTKNSLKRHLYQTNFSSNLYRKSIGRIISTTNSLKGNLYKKKIKRTPYKKNYQEKIYKTNNSREISQTMSKETFTNKALHKNVQTKISIKSSCSNKTLKRK